MNKILFRWLGPSLVPAVFLGTAWAQTAPDAGGYGPRMMWWDGGWTMMFFGPLFMIVTLAALVAAIVFLVRWFGGGFPGSVALLPSSKSPLDILKERFARGEIDKTEFEERRRVLAE
jgi:putative membrane protein